MIAFAGEIVQAGTDDVIRHPIYRTVDKQGRDATCLAAWQAVLVRGVREQKQQRYYLRLSARN